jgi:lysophospholipase L1-like esterase
MASSTHRGAFQALNVSWALALLLLAGCGSESSLPRLAPGAVILAFGDSLTEGTGAGAGESYPAVLEMLSGRRVVNEGIRGEESDAGLERLAQVLAQVNPDLVILGHGGNDFLRKRDLARTEANLRRMVELVRERHASVVLVGIPKPGIFLGTHPLYERIAESMGVPLEGDIMPEVLGDSDLKSDPFHPNAAGYREVAAALHRLLQDSGAL